MANTIQVKRKDFINQLSSIAQDNVGIADVVINRAKLLQALKLQAQPQADVLTIAYGKVSWQYDYKMKHTRHNPQDRDGMPSQHDDCEWVYEPYTKEPEPCISFSCDHTIMRFLNRPKVKYGEPQVKYLNFIDHEDNAKPELTGIPLDTQELLRALTFVLPCVAVEQSRPVLNCLLLDSGDDVIKLVAADGFRLGVATIPAKGIPTDKVLINPAELLTFLKSIKPVGKGKSKYYPEVYLSYADKTAKFAYLSGCIELDRQPGTFPQYELLIPKDGTHVQFIASDMLTATKALSYIAKDGSGIIRLQFQIFNTSGKVTLTTKSEDLGDTTAECDAKVEADCKIAVNTKYLIDLLRLCGDSMVDLMLTTPSSPMVFNIGSDRQCTVMPMFVQWPEDKPQPKVPENVDTEAEESPEPTPEEINETASVEA